MPTLLMVNYIATHTNFHLEQVLHIFAYLNTYNPSTLVLTNLFLVLMIHVVLAKPTGKNIPVMIKN